MLSVPGYIWVQLGQSSGTPNSIQTNKQKKKSVSSELPLLSAQNLPLSNRYSRPSIYGIFQDKSTIYYCDITVIETRMLQLFSNKVHLEKKKHEKFKRNVI